MRYGAPLQGMDFLRAAAGIGRGDETSRALAQSWANATGLNGGPQLDNVLDQISSQRRW